MQLAARDRWRSNPTGPQESAKKPPNNFVPSTPLKQKKLEWATRLNSTRAGDESSGVPRMRRASKILLIVLGLALVSGVGLLYGLFHGYFDHGKFEVKQVQWSPGKQAAMVVERSDQQALSGYTYFVLIGDHVFTRSELRHEYRSNAVVFAAADSCLDLHWHGSTTLVIACDGQSVTRAHIDVEKHQSRGIVILYDNIPNK
jgi:hypothetical protein